MPDSGMSEEKDRRAAWRVRVTFPVRFRREDNPEKWCEASAENISARGILILSRERVEVSTRVVASFPVPGERAIRPLSGIVTRLEVAEPERGFWIGIHFTDIDEADRGYIESALKNTDIVRLLRLAVEAGASDVHLSANHPPLVRVAGRIKPLRSGPIAGADLKYMIYALMDERQRLAFEKDLELNFSVSVEPTIRYRVNVHSQRSNVEAAFRRIEPVVRTIADCNLPPLLSRLAELQDGLVLVTGPTGAGKTTTVAAMVDHINTVKAAVVITLENPIEYVHTYKQSVIKQREIGTDTRSFPIALREAMRQDPDVIVVGEVRDEETMRTVLDAAETGHLVMATFPASDCAQSILRVIHFFQKSRQEEAQLQLSNCLRAVVSQRLLPRADATGVMPATEILINTPGMANMIRSGAIEQIPSLIQTSTRQGMHNLDSSLEKLYRGGYISLGMAKQHSLDGEELARRLEGPGSADQSKKK